MANDCEGGTGQAGVSRVAQPHSRRATPFAPRLPERSGGRASRPFFREPQTKAAKPRPSERGLGGRAQGPHRRSRRCAAAATCRTPALRGAETPLPKRRRNRQAAGRPEDSGGARGAAGAQALSVSAAPGSTRQGGWTAPRSDPGKPASGGSPGRGLLACTQRASRVTSASRLLPSPAFAESPSGATRRAPPLPPGRARRPRATPGGGSSGGPSRLRRQLSAALGACRGFPGGPFANRLTSGARCAPPQTQAGLQREAETARRGKI